eukprot:g10860.t1
MDQTFSSGLPAQGGTQGPADPSLAFTPTSFGGQSLPQPPSGSLPGSPYEGPTAFGVEPSACQSTALPEGKYCELPQRGVKLYYEIQGPLRREYQGAKEEVLFLLMGSVADLRKTTDQQFVNAGVGVFKVFAFDHRNTGRSTIKDWVDWDGLGWSPLSEQPPVTDMAPEGSLSRHTVPPEAEIGDDSPEF